MVGGIHALRLQRNIKLSRISIIIFTKAYDARCYHAYITANHSQFINTPGCYHTLLANGYTHLESSFHNYRLTTADYSFGVLSEFYIYCAPTGLYKQSHSDY